MSVLWTDYKAGQYELPEVKSIDEEVVEAKAEAMEAAVAAVKDTPKVADGATQEDYLSEYTRITNRLTRFGRSMTEEKVNEAKARLAELATLTAPSNYRCDPTDAWKCWTGPSSLTLIVNENKRVAFTCTRDWWNTHYQGAFYVTYETVSELATIERLAGEYARRRKLVRRPPLPGVEVKLPKSLREKKLRGN